MVVFKNDVTGSHLQLNIETSPGTNYRGSLPSETGGWYYAEYKNGQVTGLSDDWDEKLEIVEEFPGGELPKLPVGYGWAGGFPQFRKPNVGESFLAYNQFAQAHTGTASVASVFTPNECFGGRRLIVVVATQPRKAEVATTPVAPQETPDVAYRDIDPKADIPQRTDEFWCDISSKWITRDNSIPYLPNYKYRRLIAASPPTESSDVTYRDIDTKIEIPKSTDEFYCDFEKRWITRDNDGPYLPRYKYRRLIATSSPVTDPIAYRDIDPKVEKLQKGDQFHGPRSQEWMNVISLEYGFYNSDYKYRRPIATSSPNQTAGDVRPQSVPVSVSGPLAQESVTMSNPNVQATLRVAKTVSKTLGKIAWSQVNYWGFEPALNIAKRIMWSVRYIALTSAVAGGGYAYYHPEAAKEVLYDCLPKISISVEGPEILRG